jgi:hypothetical protein
LYADHLVGSLRTSSGMGRVNTFQTYWTAKNLYGQLKTWYVSFPWKLNVIWVRGPLNLHQREGEISNDLICELRCKSERWKKIQ